MGLNNKFLKGGNRHAKTKGMKNFPKVTLNTPSDVTKGRSDWCFLGRSGPEVPMDQETKIKMTVHVTSPAGLVSV